MPLEKEWCLQNLRVAGWLLRRQKYYLVAFSICAAGTELKKRSSQMERKQPTLVIYLQTTGCTSWLYNFFHLHATATVNHWTIFGPFEQSKFVCTRNEFWEMTKNTGRNSFQHMNSHLSVEQQMVYLEWRKHFKKEVEWGWGRNLIKCRKVSPRVFSWRPFG